MWGVGRWVGSLSLHQHNNNNRVPPFLIKAIPFQGFPGREYSEMVNHSLHDAESQAKMFTLLGIPQHTSGWGGRHRELLLKVEFMSCITL